MSANQIISRLKSIVGNEGVLSSEEDRISYSYDGTPLLSQLPIAAVAPKTVEQISQVVKTANEEGFSIVPRGSGTGLSGGAIPMDNSIVLLLNRWNKIVEIDQENLTTWVEPGVITAQLHRQVEKLGLFYPPDPGSMNICTLGGNVAENSGGLRGLKYGVTKNYVLGMEVVLPTGDIANFGGKNVKDVAGYNLKDLLVGSEGTLGIITRILFRLIPLPPASKTMLAFFPTIHPAAEVVSKIIAARIIPVTLEFLDRTTIQCVEKHARIGLSEEAGALLLIEVDGHRAQVEEEAELISNICKKGGASQVNIARDEDEALRLKSARRAAFPALARVKPTSILEDVTVPRSNLAKMVDRIHSIAEKHRIIIGNFGHAGDGNLHPTGLIDEKDEDELKRAKAAFEEIFYAAKELGGTITGEHGVGLSKKRFLPDSIDSGSLELMRNLKQFLDPNGILNPGKIFDPKPKCEGSLAVDAGAT